MNNPDRIGQFFLSREKNVREFIFILYGVGIAGTALPLTREVFIFLTPFVLLISLFVLWIFHDPQPGIKVPAVLISIFAASFLVEMAGVNTGRIFGDYSYGRGLGLKILETPLLIGLNWVLLVYCTAAIFEKRAIGNILKITAASLLMVAYDLVMEQVAPVMDMWSFRGDMVPFRNYLAWFIMALAFHTLLKITGIKVPNRFAPLIFWCQAVFFVLLLIIFKIIK